MADTLKTPKIIEDVRLNNVGEVKIRDITNEANLRQRSMDALKNRKQASHLPPSSHRTLNLFKLLLQLSHQIYSSKVKPITSSLPEMLFYFINHLILLWLFFFIAIFKNFQFAYRKTYLKFLSLTYYPNKSPQVIRDDVNQMTKIPKSISCILDLKDDDDENGGKDGFMNLISELAAWTVSAGINKLIIYEYTGAMNQSSEFVVDLSNNITKNLVSYFGSESVPRFSIKVPNKNLILYSDETLANSNLNETYASGQVDLEIDLLSRVDGKPTLVELTKTMSELAVNGDLSINDITIDLIDEELVELVGPEPDLLICFSPSLNLQDYPPWHIRLSEIYWEPDNKDVNYAVFIRALKQFSGSKINLGK
ncbi:conserved hypothetical protein [Lodderomyces elongisporus NRRL YB-4239]|uniref:ditrans,polycis-polyprenyl diphosphate synthase [(2E,6E)-farnesyldiphosphate specific] n=1 Tax=Lodderomyces elongisporus (strain ATCC 11503 / CBS 2605 / JCM 1781 / NBRC 1676 / NRRL YB-4239) TaxID=379508 RepID=A5DZR2_LODEL|nr:conserved hypothetical protein [Lodderomyces elongisporus NRRL YB-4239]